MTTYVRARNGGWYASPLFIFPEGFLHFDEKGVELVLWLDERQSYPDPWKVLALVLGPNHGVVKIGTIALARRLIPSRDNTPPVFHAAAYAALELTRRIPEPTSSGGCERRISRVGPDAYAIDLPANPNDAHELQVSR